MAFETFNSLYVQSKSYCCSCLLYNWAGVVKELLTWGPVPQLYYLSLFHFLGMWCFDILVLYQCRSSTASWCGVLAATPDDELNSMLLFFFFFLWGIRVFWGWSNWNNIRLVLIKKGLGLWACVHQMMKTTHSEILGKYLSRSLGTVLHAVHSKITCSRQMKYLEYAYYIPRTWGHMTWWMEDHGAVPRRSLPDVLLGVSNVCTFQWLSTWSSVLSVDLLPINFLSRFRCNMSCVLICSF